LLVRTENAAAEKKSKKKKNCKFMILAISALNSQLCGNKISKFEAVRKCRTTTDERDSNLLATLVTALLAHVVPLVYLQQYGTVYVSTSPAKHRCFPPSHFEPARMGLGTVGIFNVR
jgi:hypothetical protein